MTPFVYGLIILIGVISVISLVNNGSIDLDSLTTDLITEGLTNVYFSTSRARQSIYVQGSGVTYDQDTGVITANITGDLSGLSTDDVSEGTTNQYFTEERARNAISATGDVQYDSTNGVISFTDTVTSVNTLIGDVVLDTDDVSEGTTNQYFTEERARGAISATGDVQYDSTTGVISFTDTVTSVNTLIGDEIGRAHV
jgi:hypothetical protein